MKRNFPATLFAMGLIAAMAGGARADDDDDEGEGNARPKLDGQVKELINRIDPARIQNTIEKLATFETRNSCSTNLAPDPGRDNGTKGILASQDFIFAQFASIKGLRVAFAPFFHGNCPTSLTRNVVAWLPGKKHPERLVVIGGHLDSRSFGGLDTNPDTSALLAAAGVPPGGARVTENAPAGDDAGAQTTVVLEAAHALARARFDNTIVFISFSGEEQGLFGSADVAVPGRLAAITGIPNATVMTTDNTSPNRGLMRFIATFGVSFVPGFNMRPILREDRPGRASDQASFIANRVPAVRFIESHECSSSPVDNSCPATGADLRLVGRPCPSPFAALRPLGSPATEGEDRQGDDRDAGEPRPRAQRARQLRGERGRDGRGDGDVQRGPWRRGGEVHRRGAGHGRELLPCPGEGRTVGRLRDPAAAQHGPWADFLHLRVGAGRRRPRVALRVSGIPLRRLRLRDPRRRVEHHGDEVTQLRSPAARVDPPGARCQRTGAG